MKPTTKKRLVVYCNYKQLCKNTSKRIYEKKYVFIGTDHVRCLNHIIIWKINFESLFINKRKMSIYFFPFQLNIQMTHLSYRFFLSISRFWMQCFCSCIWVFSFSFSDSSSTSRLLGFCFSLSINFLGVFVFVMFCQNGKVFVLDLVLSLSNSSSNLLIFSFNSSSCKEYCPLVIWLSRSFYKYKNYTSCFVKKENKKKPNFKNPQKFKTW